MSRNPEKKSQLEKLAKLGDLLKPKTPTQSNVTGKTEFELTPLGLSVPKRKEIVIATPAQVPKLTQSGPESQELPPLLSARELLILQSKPSVFIAEQVLKAYQQAGYKNKHGAPIETATQLPDPIRAVLAQLNGKSSIDQSDASATERFKQEERVATTLVIKSYLGPLEDVSLVIADMLGTYSAQLNHHESGQSGEMLVLILHNLLTKYRLQALRQEYLPEMPDLSRRLVEVIEKLSNPTIRWRVYDCLEQISLPLEFVEPTLWAMDAHHDLSHPLAFALTMRLVQQPNAQKSGWLKTQASRRETLIDLLEEKPGSHMGLVNTLDGQPQTLLDLYPRLQKLSQGLVTGRNFFVPPKVGKAGLEIEFILGVTPEYYSSTPDWPYDQAQPRQKSEIRRSSSALPYDTDFLTSLTTLAHWLRDHASIAASFHAHLDRVIHHFPPVWGYLLERNLQYPAALMTDKATWEMRTAGLPFDREVNRVTIAALAAYYELITTSAEMMTEQPQTPEELTLKETDTLETAIWGHLLKYLPRAEQRLAALLALQHTSLFRAFDPLSLAATYDVPSQHLILRQLLETSIYSGEQQKSTLELLASLDEAQLLDIYTRQTTAFSAENDQYLVNKLHIAQIWGTHPKKYRVELNLVMQEESFTLRLIAARAFAQYSKHKQFIPEIRILLQDDNPIVFNIIFSAISPDSGDDFRDILIRIACDTTKNALIRMPVLQMLLRNRQRENVAFLKLLLDPTKEKNLTVVSHALACIQKEAVPELGEQIIALLENQDPSVRRQAFALLSEHFRQYQFVLSQTVFAEKNSFVKKQFIESLFLQIFQDNSETPPSLIKMFQQICLSDEDEDLTIITIHCLLAIKQTDFDYAAVYSDTRHSRVRHTIFAEFWASDPKQYYDRFVSALKSDDATLRLIATQAASNAPHAIEKALLKLVIFDSDPLVRKAVYTTFLSYTQGYQEEMRQVLKNKLYQAQFGLNPQFDSP